MTYRTQVPRHKSLVLKSKPCRPLWFHLWRNRGFDAVVVCPAASLRCCHTTPIRNSSGLPLYRVLISCISARVSDWSKSIQLRLLNTPKKTTTLKLESLALSVSGPTQRNRAGASYRCDRCEFKYAVFLSGVSGKAFQHLADGRGFSRAQSGFSPP